MAERRKLLTFYTLLLSQTLSLMGSKMTGLALGIWIFNETGNATPLTLVAFFSWLPRLLSASLAGVIADRWDRRYVMALADAGQALGTIFLLVTFASGTFQLWHLYIVAIIQATFDIFQGPAFMAATTMLVPDSQRSRANSVMLVTSPLAGIIAPAITGFFYALVGVTGIIVIDLVTFLIGVAVVLAVHIPMPAQTAEGQAARGSIWRESLTGLQFVWRRKPLLMVFVFTGMTNFFAAAMMTLQTPYILLRTGSEAALGTLLSIYSLGSLTGTLLMAAWGGPRKRIYTMMPGIATMGLAIAFLGTQREAPFMAIAMFIMALFPPMNNVSIISILQQKVPPDLQGRVFAAISQMSITLIPLSYLISGPLTDRVFEPAVLTPGWSTFAGLVGSEPGAGIGLMMVVSGLAITMVSLAIYSIPMVRGLETALPDYVPEAAAA